MKKLRHILNITIWTLFLMYNLVYVLMHIPIVQRYTASCVAKVLEEKFGAKTSIGSINLGLLNRLIVDDFTMHDKSGRIMLRAARLSVSINPLELASGNIEISSAQIFGLKAKTYKTNAQAKANFQFVIDSLSSKEKKESSFNLRINSFIIRRGEIFYDRYDQPFTPGKLSPHHIHVSDISSHIIVRHVSDKDINATVKKLSLKEASGIDLRELSFSVRADKKGASLENFLLQLPQTVISSKSITASYNIIDGKPDMNTLDMRGSIEGEKVCLSDFAPLVPLFKNINRQIRFYSSFGYKDNTFSIKKISLRSADKDLLVEASAFIPTSTKKKERWGAKVDRFHLGEHTTSFIKTQLSQHKIEIPKLATNIKHIDINGGIEGTGKDLKTKFTTSTNLGAIKVSGSKVCDNITLDLSAEKFNIKELLSVEKLGTVSVNIKTSATLNDKKISSATVKGIVSQLEYNGYSFNDINIDASYAKTLLRASMDINDPYCNINAKGSVETKGNAPHTVVHTSIKRLNPQRINLSNKWGDTDFSMSLSSDITGKTLQTISGNISIDNFLMQSGDENYAIDNIYAELDKRHIAVLADFGSIEVNGKYNFTTLGKSLTALIKSKLPTMPWLGQAGKTNYADNNFALEANIDDTQWMEKLLGIPFRTNQPISLKARIDDTSRNINAKIDMPAFAYDGSEFRSGTLDIHTTNDTLFTQATVNKLLGNNNDVTISLDANAANNTLGSTININYNAPIKLKGELRSKTQFYESPGIGKAVMFNLEPSTVLVQDTAWNVAPSSIIYSGKGIQVNNFAITHGQQHIKVNGKANNDRNDSICIDLKDIDVDYVLNLVNFHSVTFNGLASGKAYVKSVMETPEAYARLRVDKFRFQGGRMGTLFANVEWNKKDGEIDIDAHADDGDASQTIIKGYVSPGRNYLNLGITAKNTNIEFLESFCDSFMSDINAHANGFAQVYGDLSAINLRGLLVADGKLKITTLNTEYTLENDTVRMLPNEIVFNGDTVKDRNGNHAIVTGALHHKNLSRLTYDINIKADKFLCYDFHDYGSNTFFGTVYATGKCGIVGRPHNIRFDIDMKPEKGSFIEYNASSPDAVNDGTFLTWVDHSQEDSTTTDEQLHAKANDIADLNESSDMYINFDVDCTPDFTLRVLMDETTSDKIALNGNGAIKATYFNKGNFDMFGTYLIDHGSYNLTIQNIIRKDFRFQQGSYIVFGGNPYNALLNLKAVYPVNGVSLADLKIGNSFSSNNVRVDCIMNITGTPEAVKLDFDFDMPTVNNDAKQMVRSIINSEEEMNQQVVYLLAIGRFYTDGKNNQSQEDAQQSQTSLAMQSLISGTLSQQINNVLGSLIKNRNWNFGTNISTGTEGFNNAEYEGLLSGSLFSNRLLVNGQFGYRDNQNATSSFIGDFDVKYLLTPSGSIAIKVYNQTNDRYFTRSSLNTQGLGIILKKDFNSWKDLFRWGKNRETTPLK